MFIQVYKRSRFEILTIPRRSFMYSKICWSTRVPQTYPWQRVQWGDLWPSTCTLLFNLSNSLINITSSIDFWLNSLFKLLIDGNLCVKMFSHMFSNGSEIEEWNASLFAIIWINGILIIKNNVQKMSLPPMWIERVDYAISQSFNR